ncbi:MAG: AzlD family protein [Beijerinckiaceae bacterium]
MMIRPEFLPLLVLMGLASFFCRASGFWLMRFVTVTPRLEAALKATPLAVMVGIVVPVAARGRLPEIIALVAIVIVMRFARNDLIAAFAGVGVVAVARMWL